MGQGADILSFEIDETLDGLRIDKALPALIVELSRARLQDLLGNGHVTLNGAVYTKASRKVNTGDVITLDMPPPTEANPQPEDIPLDVVFEDEHLLVINKQAGLVVHPGAGNHTGTLVNALLHYCGDSLSGIGGVLRPGIVHRLDKDTTGLMVAAKSDVAHQGLSSQLEDRSLTREYLALALGIPVPRKGFVDEPIGRHASHRLKMAVNTRNSKTAKTHYIVEQSFQAACCLLRCKLESGRTHQIRVHMGHLGHFLVGDPLYGPQPTALKAALNRVGYDSAVIDAVMGVERQALHAQKLAFVHPVSGDEMSFDSDLPVDMKELIDVLGVPPKQD